MARFSIPKLPKISPSEVDAFIASLPGFAKLPASAKKAVAEKIKTKLAESEQKTNPKIEAFGKKVAALADEIIEQKTLTTQHVRKGRELFKDFNWYDDKLKSLKDQDQRWLYQHRQNRRNIWKQQNYIHEQDGKLYDVSGFTAEELIAADAFTDFELADATLQAVAFRDAVLRQQEFEQQQGQQGHQGQGPQQGQYQDQYQGQGPQQGHHRQGQPRPQYSGQDQGQGEFQDQFQDQHQGQGHPRPQYSGQDQGQGQGQGEPQQPAGQGFPTTGQGAGNQFTSADFPADQAHLEKAWQNEPAAGQGQGQTYDQSQAQGQDQAQPAQAQPEPNQQMSSGPAEPTAQPEQPFTQAPQPNQQPNQQPDLQPNPQTQQQPELQPEQQSQPEPQPQPEPQAEHFAEPEPAVNHDLHAEPHAPQQAAPQPQADMQTESVAEPVSEPVFEPVYEPVSEPGFVSGPEPEAQHPEVQPQPVYEQPVHVQPDSLVAPQQAKASNFLFRKKKVPSFGPGHGGAGAAPVNNVDAGSDTENHVDTVGNADAGSVVGNNAGNFGNTASSTPTRRPTSNFLFRKSK